MYIDHITDSPKIGKRKKILIVFHISFKIASLYKYIFTLSFLFLPRPQCLELHGIRPVSISYTKALFPLAKLAGIQMQHVPTKKLKNNLMIKSISQAYWCDCSKPAAYYLQEAWMSVHHSWLHASQLNILPQIGNAI